MDLQRLSLPNRKITSNFKEKIKKTRYKKGEKFLKGPIPWDWLSKASQNPGKSLNVALAVWFLSGLNRSSTISLSGSVLRGLGVKRHAGYRALKSLEHAGLISVYRHKGRNPVVTILNEK
jgi:hypothetical protein